jgi:hypothetical protein
MMISEATNDSGLLRALAAPAAPERGSLMLVVLWSVISGAADHDLNGKSSLRCSPLALKHLQLELMINHQLLAVSPLAFLARRLP